MTKPTNVVLKIISFMFRYIYTLEYNLIKNLGTPNNQQTNQIILDLLWSPLFTFVAPKCTCSLVFSPTKWVSNTSSYYSLLVNSSFVT